MKEVESQKATAAMDFNFWTHWLTVLTAVSSTLLTNFIVHMFIVQMRSLVLHIFIIWMDIITEWSTVSRKNLLYLSTSSVVQLFFSLSEKEREDVEKELTPTSRESLSCGIFRYSGPCIQMQMKRFSLRVLTSSRVMNQNCNSTYGPGPRLGVALSVELRNHWRITLKTI